MLPVRHFSASTLTCVMMCGPYSSMNRCGIAGSLSAPVFVAHFVLGAMLDPAAQQTAHSLVPRALLEGEQHARLVRWRAFLRLSSAQGGDVVLVRTLRFDSVVCRHRAHSYKRFR